MAASLYGAYTRPQGKSARGHFRRPSQWHWLDLVWVVAWWLAGSWLGLWTGVVLGGWAAWGVVWQPAEKVRS